VSLAHRRTAHSCIIALLVAVSASCFTGEAALSLPCVMDAECGEDQRCLGDHCALPGSVICGNGLLDPRAGEQCDEGDANADDAACTSKCQLAICGDGLLGPGEACDADDRAACTEDCLIVYFADDMESGQGKWEHAVVDAPPPIGLYSFKDTWVIQSIDGSRAWTTTNLSLQRGPGSTRLWTQTIDLRGAAAPIELSLRHRFTFKSGIQGIANTDGAILEIAADDGDFEQLSTPLYNGQIEDNGGCEPLGPLVGTNPLLGLEAFVGPADDWQGDTIDLSAYAGRRVAIGLRAGIDCASHSGEMPTTTALWEIDDVRVIGGRAAP
jgi:hypothetical protein